jgi:hypothetical protein
MKPGTKIKDHLATKNIFSRVSDFLSGITGNSDFNMKLSADDLRSICKDIGTSAYKLHFSRKDMSATDAYFQRFKTDFIMQEFIPAINNTPIQNKGDLYNIVNRFMANTRAMVEQYVETVFKPDHFQNESMEDAHQFLEQGARSFMKRLKKMVREFTPENSRGRS